MNISTERLKRITKVQYQYLRAKSTVEGFLIGLHESPYHGFSVEFSEHRQYNQGDNLKDIDWKVLAKTERYFIKKHEEETNLRCYILLDSSKSMNFNSSNQNKIEYAKDLAASLSYLLLRQKDATGIATKTEHGLSMLEPKASQSQLQILLSTIVDFSDNLPILDKETITELLVRIKKKSMIIVISDLLDELEVIQSCIKLLATSGHDVVLMHVVDKQEEDFNFKGETVFYDLETNEKIQINPTQIKREYKALYNEQFRKIQKICYEQTIDYIKVNTDYALKESIRKFLINRQRKY